MLPFLNNGMILAIFISDGNIPENIPEKHNRKCNGFNGYNGNCIGFNGNYNGVYWYVMDSIGRC